MKENKIRSDYGMSLVEILIVIAITGILAGSVVLSVSLITSRNTEKAMGEIEDMISYLQTMTMAKDGNWYMMIDLDQNSAEVVQTTQGEDSVSRSVQKTVDLNQSLKISLKGDTVLESGILYIVMNKKDGSFALLGTGTVEDDGAVSGQNAYGVYELSIKDGNEENETVLTITALTGKYQSQ